MGIVDNGADNLGRHGDNAVDGLGMVWTCAWIGTGAKVHGYPQSARLSIVPPHPVLPERAVRTRCFALIPISTVPTTTTDVLYLSQEINVTGSDAGPRTGRERHPGWG